LIDIQKQILVLFFYKKWEMMGADCCSVALTLANWGIDVTLIGNDLGNDETGHKCIQELIKAGIKHDLILHPEFETPFEFSVSDETGMRTCFLESINHDIWDTLSSKSLNSIKNADIVYLDWYTKSEAISVLKFAAKCNVPVFLNIEKKYQDPETIKSMLKFTKYCQASVDEIDISRSETIMNSIKTAGPQIVLLTLGSLGCIGMIDSQVITVPTTPMNPIDTNGAGAVFSAGFIFSVIHGLSFPRSLQFANAAAAIKCSRFGLGNFSPQDVYVYLNSNVSFKESKI
jgi:sulfofructose kinase